MKIRFYEPISGHFLETYDDLEKHKIKLSKELYTLYKSLEENEKFLTMLYEARKEMGIPLEGYDHHKFVEESTDFRNEHWFASVKAATHITEELSLDPRVWEYFRYIILANFTYLPFEPITMSLAADTSDKRVAIHITTKISKSQLIKYINNNWRKIETRMKITFDDYSLASKYVSKRDFRIIELREEDKKKYSQIADIIVEEFSIDNNDGHINEDSIKRAYHRAKKILENAITEPDSGVI